MEAVSYQEQPSPFFRDIRVVWLPWDYESSQRFFVIMEEEYPTERRPNAIFRVDGIVPLDECNDEQARRNQVMRCVMRLCRSYYSYHGLPLPMKGAQ